jgi:hypothetical protein
MIQTCAGSALDEELISRDSRLTSLTLPYPEAVGTPSPCRP